MCLQAHSSALKHSIFQEASAEQLPPQVLPLPCPALQPYLDGAFLMLRHGYARALFSFV